MPFEKHELPEIIRLTMERDQALIKSIRIHNRVLWVCLSAVSVINMILLWGIWRHIAMIR